MKRGTSTRLAPSYKGPVTLDDIIVEETDRQGGPIPKPVITIPTDGEATPRKSFKVMEAAPALPSRKLIVRNLADEEVAMDISTSDKHHHVALVIVNARLKAGYYGAEPVAPSKPSFTKAQIAKLPVELQDAARFRWTEYKDQMTIHHQRNAFYRWVVDAVTNQDGVTAIDILEARKDHQGEACRIIDEVTEF